MMLERKFFLSFIFYFFHRFSIFPWRPFSRPLLFSLNALARRWKVVTSLKHVEEEVLFPSIRFPGSFHSISLFFFFFFFNRKAVWSGRPEREEKKGKEKKWRGLTVFLCTIDSLVCNRYICKAASGAHRCVVEDIIKKNREKRQKGKKWKEEEEEKKGASCTQREVRHSTRCPCILEEEDGRGRESLTRYLKHLTK